MWVKGQSGNPKGRIKGRTFAQELQTAFLKEAKKAGYKTAASWLLNKWKDDPRMMAKLLDKCVADPPKDLNVSGSGFVFKIVTDGEADW